MLVIAIYLLAGAISGFLSGLFGVGGGLVLIPVFLASFEVLGVEPSVHMHLALGTSLSAIVFNSASASWRHWQLGNLDIGTVLQLLVGILLGTILGGSVAAAMDSELLRRVFSGFILVIAVYMASGWKPGSGNWQPGKLALTAAGSGIGFMSALFGVGGGTLTVPLMTIMGRTPQRAVAISSGCGVPIGLIGALTYVAHGWDNPQLPAGSLGYVYLPALAGIVLASWWFTGFGANLANRIPPRRLRIGFSIFLLVMFLNMLRG
ncbi:sulfite exporter TauE/SafE family protein [Aliagarivorans marinus]|uniref:sulfite exporter TauE/SafE family protein n=1 Tax=Aliagarivorans marinus TaxID=561965 RepID=UPI000428B4EF|nr:sulfite exporter TauE/SafE family protein [Aliagarivorans marinus]